jgi:RNA polymerase sigma factor (sigma-70 family)
MHDASHMRADRRAQVELAALVPVGRDFAQALPNDRALAGLQVLDSRDLPAAHVLRHVCRHGQVLAQELADCARRDAGWGVSRSKRVLAAEHEAADDESGRHAVRHPLAGVARGDMDVSVAVVAADEGRAVHRLQHLPGPTQEGDQTPIIPFPLTLTQTDPERTAARREICRVLEQAIDGLPEPFRLVFVLRDVEEMSVEETATHLALRPETVKTRLFPARRLLRRALDEQFASALRDTFPFAGVRCARTTDAVLSRLGMPASPPPREDRGGGS